MQREDKTFQYSYSAKQQAEIQMIRAKYTGSEQEDKLTLLRRLDAGVIHKANIWSLVLGVLGALVLGSGMSLFMTDLGKILSLSGAMTFVIGIVSGLVGIALVCMAYPVYNRIVKKERERIAPQIIQLTNDLLE